MNFFEWIETATDENKKSCYNFVTKTFCSLSFINRIKICYEILRGREYHNKITNYKNGEENV